MAAIQRYLLWLMILALPFNGIVPLLDIGELSREGFFYVSLLYFAASLPTVVRRQQKAGILAIFLRTQVVYILLIALSLPLSAYIIANNAYGDRTGFERYFVSVLTYAYYLSLFSLFALHARAMGIERFIDTLSRAFVTLGALLVLVCTIEIASWYSETLNSFMTALRSNFELNPRHTQFRLTGLSLEPSFNAFAMLACMPWIIYRSRFRHRTFCRLLVAVLVVLCLVSGSRTAFVGLAFMAVAYTLVKGMARPVLAPGPDGATFVICAFILGIAVPVLAYHIVTIDSSISNISRTHFAMGAVEAGLERWVGQGYGQASFYVAENFYPDLLAYNWELRSFYEGDRLGVLPPLFSWYARSFGEFGPIGYCLLALSFASSAWRLFRAGARTEDPFTRQLFMLSTLMLAQFLGFAYSIGSLRLVQFWMAWLLMAALLQLVGRPTSRFSGIRSKRLAHSPAIVAWQRARSNHA